MLHRICYVLKAFLPMSISVNIIISRGIEVIEIWIMEIISMQIT